MQLISINLGYERTIQGKKGSWITGIYKLPIQSPVQVNSYGLSDDVICDKKNNGGLDQALYVYGTPDYAWGRPVWDMRSPQGLLERISRLMAWRAPDFASAIA